MITQKVIDELYKKYRKLPSDPYSLDIPLLFDNAVNDIHHITTSDDAEKLIIGSIPAPSPFHCLPLDRIHAIVNFENWIAIVMHSSIIFLNKKNTKSYVHLKEIKRSLGDRIGSIFREDPDEE